MSNRTPNDAELILIRHAPVQESGYLIGRTDVSARIDAGEIARLAQILPTVSDVVVSPAKRCVETASALWPGRALQEDDRLWEQDFGCHDGLPLAQLPDIGVKTNKELLTYRPQGGESFGDLCGRCSIAIEHWSEQANQAGSKVALIIHAGTIRAALGMAMGNHAAALSFEIDTLSITRLRVDPSGPIAVHGVNQK